VFTADSKKTIAFGVIDLVQSRAGDLQREANSLDGTLTTAINSYQGLGLTKRSNGFPISRIKRHLVTEAVAAN
jgi:hypothetical protein